MLCSGVVVAYILAGNITTETLSLQGINVGHLPYLAVPVLALFLSNFMFKSQLKQVNTKLNIEDNLGIYQTASIIRWAILEGAAFSAFCTTQTNRFWHCNHCLPPIFKTFRRQNHYRYSKIR